MKIEIKKTKEPGLIQITTVDERWYAKDGIFIPSVTWISGYYPKGTQFYKWLASKGWDEAEAIKVAAGNKGSKVHQVIADLLGGKTVKMDSSYRNSDDGTEEELTVQEWEAVMSFVSWWDETRPTVIFSEQVVIHPGQNYAGTLDLFCVIDGKNVLIDFKTSSDIYPEHEIQLSAYRHAITDPVDDTATLKVDETAILQIGYRRNKKGFKYTEIPDRFELFLAAKTIWAYECAGDKPKQKDYPETLSLNGEKK